MSADPGSGPGRRGIRRRTAVATGAGAGLVLGAIFGNAGFGLVIGAALGLVVANVAGDPGRG